MAYLQSVANFFVSELLWTLTGGIYHLPLSVLFMWFFLCFTMRFRVVTALLSSLFAHTFSVIVYSLLALLLISMHLATDVLDVEESVIASPEWATIFLALIHAILQTLFFFVFKRELSLRMFGYTIVAFLSNGFAALVILVLQLYK